MNYRLISKSTEETMKIAQKIMSKKFPNMVICLDGDLGNGKTVFTKGVAKALEINEIITSPTFTIIKEYLDGKLPLYHMDVYRLNGNVDGIGIEEYFAKDGIVVIEWSESIKDVLPKERLDIIIKTENENENERILEIKPCGKKYEELCEAVL